MKKIIIIFLLLFIEIFASFEDGEKIFQNKCSTCHTGYVDLNILKENFFEKKNQLLNLKAPTVNMLAYAIMDSSKKIGDPNDPEMQQLEIETYLKSYLENPDKFHSICDRHILKYYDEKKSMKNELTDEDYTNLSYFFMEYKKHLAPKEKKVLKDGNFDEEMIINQAKKENKMIMVYATAKSCYFCKKMEKNVLSDSEVKEKLEKNYILVKVDMDENSLPFGLMAKYKKITPSFFVLDKDGNFKIQYPGSWTKSDFLEILQENLK